MNAHSDHWDTADSNGQRMLQMIQGLWITQVVHTIAKNSIADELAKGPATADELAKRQSIDPDVTFRLLRACASLGLVTVDENLRFGSTDLLATLRQDAPNSLRARALLLGSPVIWHPWMRLTEAVRTGERQTVAALGKELWEYYEDNPAQRRFFTDNMTAMTAIAVRGAVQATDTASNKVAVDVGGASGILLRGFMDSNPNLHGILFDLPHVIAQTGTATLWQGMESRFSAVGGSFFESVPKADLYLLKWILHDWDDASCVRILENCSQAMEQGGRVVVVECDLGRMGEPGFAPLLDLNIMLLTSGRERTVEHYDTFFSAAGLRLVKTTPINPGLIVMEAVGGR